MIDDLQEARDKILTEITLDDVETRQSFLTHFRQEVDAFASFMAEAFVIWRSFDEGSGKNEELAYVSAIAYAGFTLHVQSMKLFLSGHIVAAGNLFRQVLESIALALLCSKKEVRVLRRFMQDQYGSHNAVTDVLRNSESLGLAQEAAMQLRRSQVVYHKFSHPTKYTIASTMPFSGRAIYVGASFDEDKLPIYSAEIKTRIGLARAFPSFMRAVKLNVSRWQDAR